MHEWTNAIILYPFCKHKVLWLIFKYWQPSGWCQELGRERLLTYGNVKDKCCDLGDRRIDRRCFIIRRGEVTSALLKWLMEHHCPGWLQITPVLRKQCSKFSPFTSESLLKPNWHMYLPRISQRHPSVSLSTFMIHSRGCRTLGNFRKSLRVSTTQTIIFYLIH